MKKPDQNIKTLLDQWGRWKVRENSLAIGYPSIAAFARQRVDGDRSEGSEMLIDDDLMRVNEIIHNLRPTLKRVIVCRHITRLDKGEKPWQRLGMAQREYERCLQVATAQVAHEMSGRYAIEKEEDFVMEIA